VKGFVVSGKAQGEGGVQDDGLAIGNGLADDTADD
jgi:hypothetical protein